MKKLILLASLLCISIGAYPRFKYERELTETYLNLDKKITKQFMESISKELTRFQDKMTQYTKTISSQDEAKGRRAFLYWRRIVHMYMDICFSIDQFEDPSKNY